MIAFVFTLLLNAPSALAQDFGWLTGKLTDDRERPIDGTHIVVMGRKVKYELVTNDQGNYEVRLPPGVYRILVRARPGFAAYKRNKIQITSGKGSSLNITPKSVIYYNNCDKGLLKP
jgi:hypothetical protein